MRLVKWICVGRTGFVALLLLTLATERLHAQMRITEFMYSGAGMQGGEFIEFTNVGFSPVDMDGWAFEDDNAFGDDEQLFDLSDFGIVMPGESVILTEETPEFFRTAWNLPETVKVVGSLGVEWGHNIGRNDEIYLFDETGAVVDQLTYGDNEFAPGSIRTQMVSANPMSIDALGENDIFQWQLSSVGDAWGSWLSADGEIGNPGQYATIPGDFNKDGVVDHADLAVWEAAFGTTAAASVDGTSLSDGSDFLTWQREFSAGPTALSTTHSVPEPSSVCLIAMAGALLATCRSIVARVNG